MTLRLIPLLAVAIMAVACETRESEVDLLQEFVAYRTEIGAEGANLEKYFSRSTLEYWVSILTDTSDPAALVINAGRVRRGDVEIGGQIQVIHHYVIEKTAADRQVLILTATVDHPQRAVLFSFFYVYEAGAWRIEKFVKDMLAEDLDTDETLLDFTDTN